MMLLHFLLPSVLAVLVQADNSAPRQGSCGSDTPYALALNGRQIITNPWFPAPYIRGQSCSWSFNTEPSASFFVLCRINVPCTDSLVIGSKTYCGAQFVTDSPVGNSLTISLKSTNGTGSVFCSVRAVAASTSSSPSAPRLRAITIPPPTSRPPSTPRPTSRPPSTPPPTSRPPSTPQPTSRPPSTPPPTSRPPSTPPPTSRPPSTPSPTTRVPSTLAPTPSATCNCGIRGPNRIVGGSLAGKNEYPWQVMLLSNGGFFCGGTVIAPGWVVTAAHCTNGEAASSLSIIAGAYSMNTLSPSEQERSVARIIQHPLYNTQNQDNDIALLQLSTPLTINTAVSPICLPQLKYATYDFANQTAIATGWGATSSGGSGSDALLEVNLPMLTTAQCKTYPTIAPYITNNMLCTYQAGKDACQGDSGGPLNWVDPATQRVYLAGVTSWGIGCAGVGAPGVFTKVNNYMSWIQQNTGLSFCSP